MMRLLKFKHKQQSNLNKEGLRIHYVALFSFFFIFLSQVCAQQLTKHQLDTLVLSRFEYAVLNTNNGSECICYIQNLSEAQNATLVNSGDQGQVKFNDSTLFNGIHVLKLREQLIAMADFRGNRLIVSNLTPYQIEILVSILCPQ